MRESRRWLMIFFLVVLSGVTFILLLAFFPPDVVDTSSLLITNGYRFLTVFHGMLAGVSLGEFFKLRSNEQTGNRLLIDLVEELRVNDALLNSDVKLRKGFWILGVRSGLIRYLPDRERRRFWNVYSLITHYQEEIEVLHRARVLGEEEKLSRGFFDHIENLRGEIRRRMKTIIEGYPSDSEYALSVYEHPPDLSITFSEENTEDSEV